MRNELLEKVKTIIKEHYNEAEYGIFNTRNTAGDRMTILYEDENVAIGICYLWGYFEIFGLTDEEFQEITIFYGELRGRA